MSLQIFFFNDTATTEIYTLSLHDALPISCATVRRARRCRNPALCPSEGARLSLRAGRALRRIAEVRQSARGMRSEEHTSELQSRQYLVCRLLLEKNNNHPHAVPPLSLIVR